MILIGVALWLAGGLRIDSGACTWTGLALNGFFVGGPLVLPIPEILESMQAVIKKQGSVLTDRERFLSSANVSDNSSNLGNSMKDKSGIEPPESNLSDKASALYMIHFTLGSIVGAPLGGGLYDAFGWQKTLIIVACMSFATALIYIIQICLCRQKKDQ